MRADEKRVLVVDDDEAIRTLLLTILRRDGFHVDTAKNGAEALERLASCHYALMLLDLMMPVRSGWDVLDQLRTVERASRPLVILLTAGGEPRAADPDLVVGSIGKPFDVELLHDTIVGCITAIRGAEQTDGCPPPESDSWHKS